MTVVFLPVRGSALYSKVTFSSSKFFKGLKIFVCFTVFLNSINMVPRLPNRLRAYSVFPQERSGWFALFARGCYAHLCSCPLSSGFLKYNEIFIKEGDKRGHRF